MKEKKGKQTLKESKYSELKTIHRPLGGFYERTKGTLKDVFTKYNSLCINIDLSTTKRISLLGTFDENDQFTYKGRTYILDRDCIYENPTIGLNCVDYDVNYSLPIKRVSIEKPLKDAFYKGFPEIKQVSNPVTARRWMESTITRDLLKTPNAGDATTLMLFFILLIGIGHLIFTVWTSGVM